MAAPDPDSAVAGLLNGVTAGTYTLTTSGSTRNVLQGPVRPPGSPGVPILAVFALATGGPVNSPYLGVGKDFRVLTVQVTVRAAPRKFAEGQTLARACMTALHRQAPAGFIDCIVREGAPTFVGFDENECPRWTLNCELRCVADDP